jgi:hypothetical protein
VVGIENDCEPGTIARKASELRIVSGTSSIIRRNSPLHVLVIPPDLARGTLSKLILIDIKGEGWRYRFVSVETTAVVAILYLHHPTCAIRRKPRRIDHLKKQ